MDLALLAPKQDEPALVEESKIMGGRTQIGSSLFGEGNQLVRGRGLRLQIVHFQRTRIGWSCWDSRGSHAPDPRTSEAAPRPWQAQARSAP